MSEKRDQLEPLDLERGRTLAVAVSFTKSEAHAAELELRLYFAELRQKYSIPSDALIDLKTGTWRAPEPR